MISFGPRSRRALSVLVLAAAVIGGMLACNQLIGIQGGHARPLPTQIAAGGNFACALLSDGTVWCWGADDYQQLGHLTTVSPDRGCTVQEFDASPDLYVCNPTPTQVKTLSNIKQIALGEDFACALDTSGAVWCWGENGSGQLGGATATSFYQYCPRDFFDGGTVGIEGCSPEPQKVTGIGTATSIVAGAAHACAVTSAGVYCWGSNNGDALGSAGNIQGPVLVPKVHDIEKLASPLGTANNDFTCGVVQNGAAECWGTQPKYGPMNAGCTGNAPCEVPVSGATALIAGGGDGQFACAVGAGATLTCWGDNIYETQAITSGATSPAKSQYAAYLQMTNGAVAQRFDSRYTHVLAADNQGGVWGWGESTYGQLGDVEAGASACPAAAPPGYTPTCVANPIQIPIAGGNPVKLIAAGEDFSLAMTSDGTVWAWGANREAALGYVTDSGTPCPNGPHGSPPCNPTPTQVLIPVP